MMKLALLVRSTQAAPSLRRLRRLLVLTALGVFAFAGTASAQAEVGTFYSQETITFTDDSGGCTGLTGIVTNTVTDSGRFVITDNTGHFSGLETQSYRVDYTDGSYLLSYSPTHFEGGSNSQGTFQFTAAQQDRGTLYAADGSVIGIVSVFTLSHTTWRDTNRNGQPDSGEITANLDQFRVTCP